MYNSDINVSDIEVAYNNESKNLIGVLNEYGLSTYDEYFAELYKYYINNKDNIDLLCRINELAPDTYKILNKSLSKYWDVD